MKDETFNAEIREVNLSYLMLAQNLIRQDKDQALFRLGISEESANLLVAMTATQIAKIANTNMLLCRFRVDDEMVWSLLPTTPPAKLTTTPPPACMPAS